MARTDLSRLFDCLENLTSPDLPQATLNSGSYPKVDLGADPKPRLCPIILEL
jgi:hypothetical protein